MRLSRFLLSYFGLGELPWAPGTWGTAGAMLTAALLVHLVPGVLDHWLEVCLAWVVVAVALTVLLTPDLETAAGKDPQVIVMDEVAGYWACLAGAVDPRPTHLVAAFFVFRLLDILKPWPSGALERLPGGWGVALDDVAAGAYGAALLFAADLAATHL